MTTVSSLNPYQFAWNGWVFGAGTPYTVVNVDGLMGLPDIRVQDDIRGYTDGSYSGRDFYDARTVTIDMVILGNSTHNAQYYYNQLQSNLYPQQVGTPSQLGAFQFETTSSTGLKIMYGRVRKIETALDPEFAYGYIQTSMELYFPDPRYYDYTNTTTTISSAGLYNYGWAISCPVITVSGLSSFTITAAVTGGATDTMSFAPTGTTVVIDLLQKTITQDGSPNRSILTTLTNWISLPPLSLTTLSINSGTMTVTYSNAYV
jgi:hypothetical protein